MMQLTFVLGTAAELIKIYPVARLAHESGHRVRYLATGQSRENFRMQYRDFSLADSELSWLLQETADLEKSSHAAKWFAKALGAAIFGRTPGAVHGSDFVVVHGDTLSTLVGASLGRRHHLPVVHVEAGLRSPSLFNPFPEEITRRLVSRLASFHMAPDERAALNLRGRGGVILNTEGNTLLDAVRLTTSGTRTSLQPYALVNVHRFENLNSPERWGRIVQTLLSAAQKRRLVMVMHPQTRHVLQKDGASLKRLRDAGVELSERLPFSGFMHLLKGAEYLISDGGSNQEECSYLGKPCLLLRLSTERQEGLKTCCVLSRFDARVIERFLAEPLAYAAKAEVDGAASPSRRIVKRLAQASGS
jgi:UDP-N-acetylglucosamine 2-epimerase (non-hydrolysing)